MLQSLARRLDPATAAGVLVASPYSVATKRSTPWATGWTVHDVELRRGHPFRMFIAEAQDGRVLPLTDHPEHVTTISRTVPVQDAAAAAVRASEFHELARSMDEWGYPVSSVADITWLPHPDADQVSAREKMIAAYTERITAPRATASGDGWEVALWRVEGRRLVRHLTSISRGGDIADAAEVVEQDIPVPYSH